MKSFKSKEEMAMYNNLFSFKRFGLVLRKNWEENWKPGYGARLWATLGILLLVDLVQFISACNMRMEQLRAGNIGDNLAGFDGVFESIVDAASLMDLVFLVFAAVFVSSQLASPRQRVSWLTAPASTLEKYLASLLMSLLFVVVFLPLCFMAAEAIRVAVCSVLYPELDIPWMDYTEVLTGNEAYSLTHDGSSLAIVLTLDFFLFSLFAFGSTLWPKNSFLKTLGALLLVGFVFGWLFCTGVKLCFGGWEAYYSALMAFGHTIGGKVHSFRAEAIFHCLFLILSLYFLVLGYYRLKEMELINRW